MVGGDAVLKPCEVGDRMNSHILTFEQFQALMVAAGYDAAVERHWEPNTVLEAHSHPFDAAALVVQGHMGLACGQAAEQTLGPGDVFAVPAGQVHTERYGPEGATYWVARRTITP